MKISLHSVMVDDQDKAKRFYTEVLGFQPRRDFPVGEYRWITVVSPDQPEGPELVLEPNANPAAKTFQEAMFRQGVPLSAFEVKDLAADVARLKKAGVQFTVEPVSAGEVRLAIFSDTCGNLIQIYELVAPA